MYSPTFAGDIRQVQEHYVDEQADLLEEWQFDEESHPELDIELDFSEKLIDREERDGAPTASDDMLAQLDLEATLEEIERLQKLEVLAVADPDETEEALILGATCVFDWWQVEEKM